MRKKHPPKTLALSRQTDLTNPLKAVRESAQFFNLINLLSMKNQIIYVDPTTLIENEIVSEIYSVTENYETIKENIKTMGVLEPLIVDEDYVVISGNLRRQIAIELQIPEVPIIIRANGGVDLNIKKLQAVSHAQQRIKTYSQILSEYELLQELYPLKRGGRTDVDENQKKNKQMRENFNFSKSKLIKLKRIKSLSIELYGLDSIEYKKLWDSIDNESTTISRALKSLKKVKIKRENDEVLPNFYEVQSERIKIYNKSCENMVEIEDGEVNCIITSPPYFQMRDYGTGTEQRGLEKDVDTFIEGLVNDFRDCKRVLNETGSLFVNLGEANIDGQYNAIPHKFAMAMMKDSWVLNDEVIWIKNNPVFTQAKRTVRAHEFIFHFVKSKDYAYDISWLGGLSDPNDLISYGTTGKISNLLSAMDFRGNIIRTNSNNMTKLRRDCNDRGFHLTHNAAFPVTIPLIFILTTTKPGDTILDIYSGTATTGEASALSGRNYIGYEVKPEYIKASEVRLSEYLDNSVEPSSIAA